MLAIKSRRSKAVIILIVVVCSLTTTILISFTIGFNSENSCGVGDCQDYEFYDISSIEIDGGIEGDDTYGWDWAEKKDWCSGSGKSDDPYIIEKIHFGGDENEDPKYLIIKNSKKHFIIKDCAIYESESSWSEESGIKLINVENGIIEKNIISSNNESNGIILNDCSNNIIKNNIINNNGINGIWLINSDENEIVGNTIEQNVWSGIKLHDSDDNKIKGNNINKNSKNGITVLLSKENTINGNYIRDNKRTGVALIESDSNSIYENEFLGNNLSYTEENSKKNIFDDNIILTQNDISLIVLLLVSIVIISIILVIKLIKKRKTKIRRFPKKI